jgi:hypothetical protein
MLFCKENLDFHSLHAVVVLVYIYYTVIDTPPHIEEMLRVHHMF